MVDRVNGAPARGFWFSQDVRTIVIAATAGGDFINDIDNEVVNSELEQVIEVLQTRATVIAISLGGAGILNVIVDYANAFVAGNSETTAGSVELEIAALIDGVIGNLATVTVDTFDGFDAVATL